MVTSTLSYKTITVLAVCCYLAELGALSHLRYKNLHIRCRDIFIVLSLSAYYVDIHSSGYSVAHLHCQGHLSLPGHLWVQELDEVLLREPKFYCVNLVTSTLVAEPEARRGSASEVPKTRSSSIGR